MVRRMTELSERYGEIGMIITLGMRRRAMTQAELARAADISDTVVRRLQRGEVGNYRQSTLAKIGMALFDNPSALIQVLDGAPVPAGFDTWSEAFGASDAGYGPKPAGSPGADQGLELAALAGKLTPAQRGIIEELMRTMIGEDT